VPGQNEGDQSSCWGIGLGHLLGCRAGLQKRIEGLAELCHLPAAAQCSVINENSF
jgi:hypothetical protein